MPDVGQRVFEAMTNTLVLLAGSRMTPRWVPDEDRE
jgi:hypothetical protein